LEVKSQDSFYNIENSKKQMFYRIGNLVVRSLLSIRRPKMGEECLVLRTAGSFSPAHPSTIAALTILSRLEIKQKARILDIGCGSGILGLAAALKNSASAFGCDISLAAIKNSLQNASSNNLEKRLHLFRGSADAVSGSFHLVLANLPAAVHMEMFSHYQRLTHPKEGLLIISGFDNIQTAYIENELTQRGFMVLEKKEIDAWTAALTPEFPFTWVGMGLKKS
jgi:ribosomal protein L11 methyltransferase